MSRKVLSRLAIIAALGCGATAPLTAALAQTPNATPFDSGIQTDLDLPRMDVQNVGPARQQLLNAIQQLQADRQAGDGDAVLTDEIAVIDARQALIQTQIAADQTRMPQAPADAQAIFVARDRLLQAEEVVGTAQRKMISDQQLNDVTALREDIALVYAAQQQSLRARQQWTGMRAQLRDDELPTDLQ